MPRNSVSALPTGRLSRMFKLGRVATGVAATALNHSARQLGRGKTPTAAGALLNPANAERIANELAQMRGAVMKVGQLLSMEAGDMLPRELTDLLARLRDGAHSMPSAQLRGVLAGAWGDQWRDRFESFNEEPFAAASIGQVHKAVDLSGRRLAIKVQYPGVAVSINSDLANVAALLKLFKLVPPGLDIDPLLEIARQQLHDETDYQLEARHLQQYRQHLAGDNLFRVPEVIAHLSGPGILAMSFIEGESIETLIAARPQIRDQMATGLIDLCLREFLHWGIVQSDPNFANFLYDAKTETIGLLDFGALRINEPGRNHSLARLLRATMTRDLSALVEAACEVGYIEPSDPFNYRMAVSDLIQTAAEPARNSGAYEFATSGLSQCLSDKLLYLRNNHSFQRIPPADVIFLHRKLAGIFLLCARINARVDVRAMLLEHLEQHSIQCDVITSKAKDSRAAARQ
jgi:predicted unusual protein kinase regulating ubiquinone biosynthesis (AarF/ABC1/UbiB family)